MRKLAVLVCALLTVVAFLLVVMIYSFDFFAIDYRDTYTSAVCSGNVCQDYEFTCLNGQIISSRAISGFVVFDDDWVDKRNMADRC